ncbi:hypothetical protein [Methylocystis heyeri]|uniref:Uncharacterized protein n=1 Tax=Methylocystis heyeri TaxID=391905 RepID=A0A6B8KCG5_9HYPH|nr:hypothetical protein [Methylocystis heyeri]QGM45916.1 hypothetical protein H2LOC_009485 [Methylocystis heyeri]
MRKFFNSLLAHSATILAALALLLAVFIAVSRDFGAFVMGLVVFPALLLITLGGILACIWKPQGARDARAAVVLLILTPFAAYASAYLRDRALFVVWAAMHQTQLREAMKKDGVVVPWDSWGLAGSGNDSYLIYDSADESLSVSSAEKWRERMGLDCNIVETQRMWPRLYIVTTHNCPLQ